MFGDVSILTRPIHSDADPIPSVNVATMRVFVCNHGVCQSMNECRRGSIRDHVKSMGNIKTVDL